MTNFLTSILGAFTNNNNTTKAKTTTDTSDQLTSKQLANYNTQAKDLVREYDTNRDGYLSAKEAKEMPLFGGQDLSSKMFDKLFTSLAQRGMSQVELSRTLQLMDKNEDGEVKNKERNNFMENVVSELKDGTNPNALYATLSANALRHGGAKSTGDELRNLKAQFEKYNIDKTDYTPDTTLASSTNTDEEATGFEQYKPLIEAGLPFIQGLMQNNKSSNSDNIDTSDYQAQALASQKQQLEQQLQLQQQLQASTLNASSLGVGAFPTASPMATMPLAPLTLENFLPTNNPLLAGGNNVPTAMPAQNTFAVAPLPIMNPQTQAPVAQAPPFTYIPPSDKWNVPFANAPTPVAQAQAPVAPTLVAQAPQVNGGW